MNVRASNNFFFRGLRILLVIIVLLAAYKFYLTQQEISRLQTELAKMNARIQQAEEKKSQLEEELEHINDLEYIEKIARKELGLVKPGELLLIPVEEEEEESL